jgi:hypothetical protein
LPGQSERRQKQSIGSSPGWMHVDGEKFIKKQEYLQAPSTLHREPKNCREAKALQKTSAHAALTSEAAAGLRLDCISSGSLSQITWSWWKRDGASAVGLPLDSLHLTANHRRESGLIRYDITQYNDVCINFTGYIFRVLIGPLVGVFTQWSVETNLESVELAKSSKLVCVRSLTVTTMSAPSNQKWWSGLLLACSISSRAAFRFSSQYLLGASIRSFAVQLHNFLSSTWSFNAIV